MKKGIVNFIIFTLIIILYSSCYIKKQELTIQNFKVTNNPESYIDSSGIRFMYDIKLKNYIRNSEYFIYSELYVQNSNKVFRSINNNHLFISAKKEDWDSLYENMEVFIPYDKITLPKGEHKVILKLKAEGKRLQKEYIFSKELTINIPQLFNYEEQKIKVTNFKITEKNKNLKFLFDFDFKFKAYQTKGISENENLRFCYLKTDFYDKKTGDLIEFVKYRDPSLSKFNTNEKYNRQYIFNVPYEGLKLSAGKHEIICKIRLTNLANEDFGVLFETDFTFILPQLYSVRINVNSLHLINKRKYDSSSLVGRIFSRKNKNNGKGFPDVFWRISLNNSSIFNSATMEDSYEAFPDKVDFIVDDKDIIELSVWDDDSWTIKNYELIGKTVITNKKGEFELNIEQKKFGNVNCNFDFKKVKYNPWGR